MGWQRKTQFFITKGRVLSHYLKNMLCRKHRVMLQNTSLHMMYLLQNTPVFINILHVLHACIKRLPKHLLSNWHGNCAHLEGMSVNQWEKKKIRTIFKTLSFALSVTCQFVSFGAVIINWNNFIAVGQTKRTAIQELVKIRLLRHQIMRSLNHR